MFKKFKTKELIFIALMGTLMFVLSFLVGSGLNIVTGIAAASGFVTLLIQAIAIIITVSTMKKFGIPTLMYLIYGILAIPTNMFGTPPGLQKIPLALVTGIVFDIVFYLFKYRRIGYYIGAVIAIILMMPMYLGIFYLLGFPGWEKLLKALPILLVWYIIEGLIGAFIGLKIFDKIKNKKIIRQITA